MQRRTDNYTSAAFDPYIVFDGVLDDVTTYNATILIANDTTFDTDGEGHGCVWMDAQYNWSDPEFRDECGESLNLAINTVAVSCTLSTSKRIQSDAVILTAMIRSQQQMQLSHSGWR